MSSFVNGPPTPSTAKSPKLRSGSSGDSVARFPLGAGPNWAAGLPSRAIMMRSPRSARATSCDRRVFAA